MKYFVIENAPRGKMYEYEAESKRDALIMFSKQQGAKYKFTRERATAYFMGLASDWRNYNFAKMSNITVA